jgi:hypothetical protein
MAFTGRLLLIPVVISYSLNIYRALIAEIGLLKRIIEKNFYNNLSTCINVMN